MLRGHITSTVIGELEKVSIGVAGVDARHRSEGADLLDGTFLDRGSCVWEQSQSLLGCALHHEAQIPTSRGWCGSYRWRRTRCGVQVDLAVPEMKAVAVTAGDVPKAKPFVEGDRFI